MMWVDGICDEHGDLDEDGGCLQCPTKEALIASGDFYGLACRVLDEHEQGGWATKAHHLGEAMEQCFKAGQLKVDHFEHMERRGLWPK